MLLLAMTVSVVGYAAVLCQGSPLLTSLNVFGSLDYVVIVVIVVSVVTVVNVVTL
jgi:hypothetical protein